jgi:hypothetical protein
VGPWMKGPRDEGACLGGGVFLGASMVWSIDERHDVPSLPVSTVDDLPIPVFNLIEAVNNGDVSAFLSLFPHDGVVEDRGALFRGYAQIRRWNEAVFMGTQGRMVVRRAAVAGNVVTVLATWVDAGASDALRFVFVIDTRDVRTMRVFDDR